MQARRWWEQWIRGCVPLWIWGVILLASLPPAASAQSGASASQSNATNFQSGGELSVNPRTASVSFQTDLFHLPGIVNGMGTGFTLSYRQEDAIDDAETGTRFFGMPYGWYFNISFIVDNGTYTSLYLDGTSSYVLDQSWRTLFTPVGSDDAISIATGLKQYNRADANLRPDNGSVTVGGIPSAYVFSHLGGTSRYFSQKGLLLQQSDRFGNTIQYRYSTDTSPQNARLTEIIDSWGDSVTFAYCDDGSGGCEAGSVTLTLPDGRTMGWTTSGDSRVTKITDALGMVTHLSWGSSPCAKGSDLITGITSPTGSAMAVSYACMPVCTSSSTSSCLADGNTTTWPVVDTLTQCPNISSGTVCPDGATGDDYLTTSYALGTTDNPNNYTGYPLYSPYAVNDSGADALMSSNDTAFTYVATVSRRTTSGTIQYQTENEYDFLHLQTASKVSVRARQSNGLFGISLVKETWNCYDLSAAAGVDCSSTAADYQNLPASYQMPVRTGTCVYNAGDDAQARRSVLAYTYDSFGNTLNSKVYHATDSSGIVSSCNRATALDASGLKLVLDVYKAYDTPSAAASNGFVELGDNAAHFGLPAGAVSFAYLDEDESGVEAHGALGDSDAPVLVTLMCQNLTTSADSVGVGKAVASTTKGLLSTSTSVPTILGTLPACDAPSWSTTVAPPKTTSVSYDTAGRILQKTVAWTAGYEPPDGIRSATESFAYQLTAPAGDEESCGAGGSHVLQTTHTDPTGQSSIQRSCLLNGWALSSTDADGHRTTMEHAPNGLTVKVTHPNGTYVSTDHYYACPLAQDGRTSTCPSGSAALTSCPYDTAEEKRSCMVETLHAGSDPGTGSAQSSYVDGVLNATIKDGLGREVMTRDNLGGISGAGFSAVQTRSAKSYDSLGQLRASTMQVGASSPLVYETTVELDEKLRPKLVCDPRGNAHEFVHDDVTQAKRVIFNGNTGEIYDLNDSQKLSSIATCALTAGQTAAGSGGCPTVASDTDSVACPAAAYMSYTLHDGLGLEHSVTASTGTDAEDGASIESLNGVSVFSAERLQYAYSVTATGTDGKQLTASMSKLRDLHGKSLQTDLSIAPSDGDATTVLTDSHVFNERGEVTGIENLLTLDDGTPLTDSFAYTPTGMLDTTTSYAGVAYHNYYDAMDRRVRYCFASEAGGSEGERIERDPITGKMLAVTHFTNPSDCSACAGGDCGDVDGDSIRYSYNAFGAIQSITYADGAQLQWAYDQYQRLKCHADALATANGSSCPDSPVADDFAPDPSQRLVVYTHWDDGDPYRRGMLKSMCRGMLDAASGTFVTKCIDHDYYTPVDVGGSSQAELANLVGAYSGSLKTEALCAGGSCLDGSGTLVYRTTHLYDAHGRSGSVESVNAGGKVILGSLFGYDQYDNVVHEEHVSDLDSSTESNYQKDYGYDGLLRLSSEKVSDSQGNLLESTTYEYDAGDNLVRKVHYVADAVTPTPTEGVGQPQDTPSPTPDILPPPPPETTPTAILTAQADEGCQVAPGGSGTTWLSLLLAAALLRCAPRRSAGRRP